MLCGFRWTTMRYKLQVEIGFSNLAPIVIWSPFLPQTHKVSTLRNYVILPYWHFERNFPEWKALGVLLLNHSTSLGAVGSPKAPTIYIYIYIYIYTHTHTREQIYQFFTFPCHSNLSMRQTKIKDKWGKERDNWQIEITKYGGFYFIFIKNSSIL